MVRPGGHHRPQRCRTDQKLAVVIPYRDRNIHLRIFLRHIHPFLQKQQLDYAIFVIEMVRILTRNVNYACFSKLHCRFYVLNMLTHHRSINLMLAMYIISEKCNASHTAIAGRTFSS